MSTVIYFLCLCCGNSQEVDHLSNVTASEHICSKCRELSPKDYIFVLLAKRAMRGGERSQ